MENPVKKSSCPVELRVRDHVPMAHVSDVDRSVDFHSCLGLECISRFKDDNAVTYFAALRYQQAGLMLARASGPIMPSEQAILFYMYVNNVELLREYLLKEGFADGGVIPGQRNDSADAKRLERGPTVFELNFPFYMPEGELRVHDPDGYVILIGQCERPIHHSGSIGQIGLTVSKPLEASEFYCNHLGFKLLFAADDNLVFVSDGAIRVMLSTPQGAGTIGSNSILYVKVENIESKFAQLTASKVTIERAPQLAAQLDKQDLWIGFIRDLDNNLIGIMEQRPR